MSKPTSMVSRASSLALVMIQRRIYSLHRRGGGPLVFCVVSRLYIDGDLVKTIFSTAKYNLKITFIVEKPIWNSKNLMKADPPTSLKKSVSEKSALDNGCDMEHGV